MRAPIDHVVAPPSCPECGGRGYQVRGRGKEREHRWCSRLDVDGHVSSGEALENLRREIDAIQPSRRFA